MEISMAVKIAEKTLGLYSLEMYREALVTLQGQESYWRQWNDLHRMIRLTKEREEREKRLLCEMPRISGYSHYHGSRRDLQDRPKCLSKAAYVIDNKMMCGHHAGRYLLEKQNKMQRALGCQHRGCLNKDLSTYKIGNYELCATHAGMSLLRSHERLLTTRQVFLIEAKKEGETAKELAHKVATLINQRLGTTAAMVMNHGIMLRSPALKAMQEMLEMEKGR